MRTALRSFRTKWISFCRWSRVQIPQTTSLTVSSYSSWKVNRILECRKWIRDVSARSGSSGLASLADLSLTTLVFYNRCLQSDGSPHWPEVGGYRQVGCAARRRLSAETSNGIHKTLTQSALMNISKAQPSVCVCVWSHQKALGAVGAECEGDGGSVFVRQANERRSILRHVRQAAEPTVLHAAAGHCSTTGEIQPSVLHVKTNVHLKKSRISTCSNFTQWPFAVLQLKTALWPVTCSPLTHSWNRPTLQLMLVLLHVPNILHIFYKEKRLCSFFLTQNNTFLNWYFCFWSSYHQNVIPAHA